MRVDINVGINDGREVNEPLDLSPLFASSAGSVDGVDGIAQRVRMTAVFFPHTEVDEE